VPGGACSAKTGMVTVRTAAVGLDPGSLDPCSLSYDTTRSCEKVREATPALTEQHRKEARRTIDLAAEGMPPARDSTRKRNSRIPAQVLG
jgi:hypothetical protein